MKEGKTEREESSHSPLCNLKVDQTFNRSLLEIRRSPTEAVNPSRELSKDGRVTGFIHVGSFRLNGFLGSKDLRGLHTR